MTIPDADGPTDNGALPVSRPLVSEFIDAFRQHHQTRTLETLLRDRTSDRNIIWASDEYERLGDGYGFNDEITVEAISSVASGLIKPRISKERERQSQRTKERAEVFTPSWLVNRMNNHLDEEWFRRKGTFNNETENRWETNPEAIRFPKSKGRGWHAYVESPRLEITCGEAPFVCSRYDAATGEEVPVHDRVGFLDRKLRVVTEKTKSPKDWTKWALTALKATYGFEFQGDSLIIARINVLETFCEHFRDRWAAEPKISDVEEAAHIVSWNFWQMDGFTDAIPTANKEVITRLARLGDEKADRGLTQPSLLDLLDNEELGDAGRDHVEQESGETVPYCVVYDWQEDKPFEYISLKGRVSSMGKKFYAVIGNPPYQTNPGEGNTRAQPIYDKFMDACYEVADTVELITPARFLFNAGQTSRGWNEKMLNDSHLKVLYYEPDASKVFANTDIKGGVAITLRNSSVEYGAIGVFTAFPSLNTIRLC